MIEYELSVNIKAENEEVIENLLITVESINSEKINIGAVELLSISGLNVSNKSNKKLAESYENDSWLSPLGVKKADNSAF